MVCASGCDSAIIVKWSACVCHAISHYSRNDTICFTIFYFLCNSIWSSNVVCWCSKIGASHTMVYMYITPLVAVLFAAVWANEYVSFQQIIGGIIILSVYGLWNRRKEKFILLQGNLYQNRKTDHLWSAFLFFIFGKKMRNKIAVISGIKFKNGIRKSVIRIIPGRRTPRTA